MTKTNAQIRIIDNIMSVPAIKRRHLQQDVQRHAVKQCNGDYYWNDETNEWQGAEAHKATKAEQSIINRIVQYSAGIVGVITNKKTVDEVPDFITYDNDPRGLVLKIEADKLDDEARQHCIDIYLVQDWGGDFTILFNSEVKN